MEKMRDESVGDVKVNHRGGKHGVSSKGMNGIEGN
jgi:hypothetical protein